jgi:hypothetical protein
MLDKLVLWLEAWLDRRHEAWLRKHKVTYTWKR